MPDLHPPIGMLNFCSIVAFKVYISVWENPENLDPPLLDFSSLFTFLVGVGLFPKANEEDQVIYFQP